MRLFSLVRGHDISGVSGTGTVAEGVEFSDGRVAVRWVVGDHRSTVVYDSIEDVEAIHGHDGATRIVWDQAAPEVRQVTPELGATNRGVNWVGEQGPEFYPANYFAERADRHERWVHLIGELENTPSDNPDTDADDLAIMCMTLADYEAKQLRAEIKELGSAIARLRAEWVSSAAVARIKTLTASLERVKTLHAFEAVYGQCNEDGHDWPCPTIQAIEVP